MEGVGGGGVYLYLLNQRTNRYETYPLQYLCKRPHTAQLTAPHIHTCKTFIYLFIYYLTLNASWLRQWWQTFSRTYLTYFLFIYTPSLPLILDLLRAPFILSPFLITLFQLQHHNSAFHVCIFMLFDFIWYIIVLFYSLILFHKIGLFIFIIDCGIFICFRT